MFIGTKSDLTSERPVQTVGCEELAAKLRVRYFEISAATGHGVEKAFLGFVEKIVADDTAANEPPRLIRTHLEDEGGDDQVHSHCCFACIKHALCH